MRRTQMQDSPIFKRLPLIHHTPLSTVVDQGRVSTLTGCVITTSLLRRPVTDLHRGWVLVKGVVRLSTDYAATRANGENTARSARVLLKNSVAIRGSKLKIYKLRQRQSLVHCLTSYHIEAEKWQP